MKVRQVTLLLSVKPWMTVSVREQNGLILLHSARGEHLHHESNTLIPKTTAK